MKYGSLAMSTTLEDLLRPKEVGETVVSHVLEDAKQPGPDFEAMKRMLATPNRPSPGHPQDDKPAP